MNVQMKYISRHIKISFVDLAIMSVKRRGGAGAYYEGECM